MKLLINISIARAFQNCVANIPNNSIALFNDVDRVDCVQVNDVPRESGGKEEPAINKPMILNWLDGLHLDNMIIVFTVNDVQRIDPAIIRPGRMDYHFHIDYPTYELVNEIFNYAYQKPYTKEQRDGRLPISTGAVINTAIKPAENYEEAVRNLQEEIQKRF